MRISRLRLRDVKRYRDLQIELARGLTIVRGPNEAGKTTIARALELGLTTPPAAPPADLDGLRSWDADPNSRPTVRIDFTAEPADPAEPGAAERSGTIEKSFGPGGKAILTVDGVTTTDAAEIATRLVDLTGLPSRAFFRSSALVRRGELEGLDRDDAALRERLAASISAADRGTTVAVRELERVLADLNVRGERDPGRLRIAEEAVARAQTVVDAGEAALARLALDREALGAAEVARESATGILDAKRGLLDEARRAEVLRADIAAATERHGRYAEAVTVAQELTGLYETHPSPNALPVLRQTVERLRLLDAKMVELRAMLAGEIQVKYEVNAPTRTWRPTAILAIVAILAGVGLALAGRLGEGLGNLGLVGLGAAGLGALLALLAIRQRRAASDFRRQKELADVEIDRRLRGRSQMEAELHQAEADTVAQLEGLGLEDLPAAEDLLMREEAHVARIDQLNARLDGLVGKEPLETLPVLRDAARSDIDGKTAELEALGAEARADGASGRFEGEVKAADAALQAARNGEATIRGQVGANLVDADQVAGEYERLLIWTEQLATLQRRARVHEAALRGLERATQSTMAKATRYLEKRMAEGIARITNGRYRRVRIDDTTLDIELVAPEKGDWVNVRALSDGLLTQVYLVARLGLIRHATGDRRPPLVLDDPFASFDDLRAARAFAVLRDLTRDFQVIYLAATDRYDQAADAIVELDGPAVVDDLGGEPAAAAVSA